MEFLLFFIGFLIGLLLGAATAAACSDNFCAPPALRGGRERSVPAGGSEAAPSADALDTQWQALFAYEGACAAPDEPAGEEAVR